MDIQIIQIVQHSLRLGAYLQREGNRILHDFDLNQQQFIVLKRIEEKGPLSQKSICSDLLFEKSNISKITGKLISLNLVSMSYSADDNRVSVLTITGKGKNVVVACMKKLNQWNSKWLTPLSKEEASQTLTVLNKLNALID